MTEPDKKRLARYIICCHVDRPMEEEGFQSIYNVPIQAGAALTDQRICRLNDHDGFAGSISDRNKRYSEMTAMYRIRFLADTEYIGIEHYRRRFLLDDEELARYMDSGFDLITTKSFRIPEIISENYRVSLYAADWDLFMEILSRFHPEDMTLAKEVYSKDHLHPCNMNIFRAEVYREYCDYVFPMLDAFYQKSPLKTDLYQRRDVGFIGERLSTLFVEKKILEGARVYEAPFRDLRTKKWDPKDECDLKNADAVYEVCKKFYLADDISKCRLMVANTIDLIGVEDDRLRSLAYLFRAGVREQRKYPKTMYEYLPLNWRKDLDTLLSAFDGMGTIIQLLSAGITPEGLAMYHEFMAATGFSQIVFKTRCEMEHVPESLYDKISGMSCP